MAFAGFPVWGAGSYTGHQGSGAGDLRNLSPVTVERWFYAPNDELIPEDWGGAGEEPVSPRDWLLMGLPPRRVALLARYLGETA